MSEPRAFRALGVETATDICSVAACAGPALARRDHDDVGSRSRLIYTWIAEVLEELNLRLTDLDAVAFGRGPGAFTGLRVGASVAQALGRGAALPVCAVSTLEVLAVAAAGRCAAPVTVVPCLDARMGEIYVAAYRVVDGRASLLLPETLGVPESMRLDGSEPFIAAGNGWQAYPVLLDRFAARVSQVRADLRPDAASLLRIAAQQFASGAVLDAADAQPVYLRDRVTG